MQKYYLEPEMWNSFSRKTKSLFKYIECNKVIHLERITEKSLSACTETAACVVDRETTPSDDN